MDANPILAPTLGIRMNMAKSLQLSIFITLTVILLYSKDIRAQNEQYAELRPVISQLSSDIANNIGPFLPEQASFADRPVICVFPTTDSQFIIDRSFIPEAKFISKALPESIRTTLVAQFPGRFLMQTSPFTSMTDSAFDFIDIYRQAPLLDKVLEGQRCSVTIQISFNMPSGSSLVDHLRKSNSVTTRIHIRSKAQSNISSLVIRP